MSAVFQILLVAVETLSPGLSHRLDGKPLWVRALVALAVVLSPFLAVAALIATAVLLLDVPSDART